MPRIMQVEVTTQYYLQLCVVVVDLAGLEDLGLVDHLMPVEVLEIQHWHFLEQLEHWEDP